jgi:raffinose/stachyose/melibiose transport system permease protein
MISKSALSPKKYKKPTASTPLNIFLTYLLFAVLMLVVIYPLVWVATNSFKTDTQLFDKSWSLPKQWNWQNYVTAWKYGIAKYILNSVIVTVSTVFLNLVVSVMAAYALSRFKFRGSMFMLFFILGGLMLAPEVSLIPLFRILSWMGLYNTYWAMILPNLAFGIPFTTFLIRSYMLGLAKDFEEAATLDGASTFQIFVHVVVPLCRPILASAALLDAMRVWNEFMFGLTFITSDKLKTVPVGLMAFSGALREQYTVIMAGLIISAVPMIILYMLTQKQFIRGLAAGGLRG